MAVFTGTDGADALVGGPAIDRVTGGPGADTLSGGDGSDVLEGGPGNDVLYGHGAADAGADPGAIRAVRVAGGLAQPVFAASPPNEPDRLYILERNEGRIQVLDLTTGTLRPTPFLDIPQDEFGRGGERGVLGLAFHPDYAANGRFFIYLTTPIGDLQLREYSRPSGGGAVDPASGRALLTIPHSTFTNHNGGWISFGPDGRLYIGTGDGGGSGDPSNNAQNADSLLGKILRLDVNGDAFPSDPGRNYAIPADNPFVGVAGADEVWALGLRNPYRASFDAATGDLYIADVGEAAREEINYVAAGSRGGLNFGWRLREGTAPFRPDTSPGPGVLIEPVLDYGRGPAGGQSVTGGLVNRGPGGAQGMYVFGDFVSGNLFSARVVNGVAEDFLNRNGQLRIDAGTVNQFTAFVQDGRGRVYLLGLDGDVHRLDFSEGAGDGDDTLNGGEGDDVAYGGVGGDRISGGAGADALNGGPGADLIGGGDGADVIDGGAGDDFIGGERDPDRISGGAGNDRLFGDGGNDLIGGGDGADGLFGGDADDFMGGEAGDDFLDGASGTDVLFGDAGNDTALGGPGNDRLFGGEGDDVLAGRDDQDLLDGGAGDDRLEGGLGDDVLLGGAGDDRALFNLVTDGSDRTDLGAGNDLVQAETQGRIRQIRLTFDGGEVGDGRSAAPDGGLAIRLQGEDLQPDVLVGPISRFDDEGITFVTNGENTFDVRDGAARGERFTVVQLGSSAGEFLNATLTAQVVPFNPVYINGGGGDDRIAGGTAADVLVGGVGNDLIGGAPGDDLIEGGDGDDFVGGEAGADRISGGAGADRLFGDVGNDLIGGGAGADGLFGGDGDDFMGGEADNDFLDGGGGVDVLFGDAGDDVALGGAGNDRLFGQDGADTLTGQAGDDFVDGGAGVDTAVFRGLRSTYAVVTSGGVTTVTGGDGVDRLIAVERLQFDDGVTVLSAPTPADDEAQPYSPASVEVAPLPDFAWVV